MTYVMRAVCVATMLATVSMAGCASRRGPYNPPPTSERVSTSAREEQESQLRDLVQRRKIQEAHSREENQQEVKRKAPYFFKEYSSYTDDAEPQIEFQETESRSAPLLASVVVPKVRYATRLHRARDEAMRDDNFIRDTGYERQEYALRNGRWVNLGDTFVAETSEEQVNGVWTPVREEPETLVNAEDESGGWFKRTLGKLIGD